MSSKRPGESNTDPVRPPLRNVSLKTINEGEASGVNEERSESGKDRTDGPEQNEGEPKQKGRRPIVSPVPERPTDQEVAEHNTTHSHP